MPEKAIISHRGEKYEIGRGKRFYGIWAVGAPYETPLDRWPETRDGWGQAWMRFTAIEVPGTINTVKPQRAGLRSALSRGRGASPDPAGDGPAPADAARKHGGSALLIGEGLLVLGVVLGLAGLFPDYAGGQSLLSQSDQVVPHLCYVIAWAASAGLIALSVSRPRTARLGALFALGLSAVTFGLFLFDIGDVTSGAKLGSGLVVSLLGWLACTVGAAFALVASGRDADPVAGPAATPTQAAQGPAPYGVVAHGPAKAEAGWPARPTRGHAGPLALLVLAGIGTAAAYAPSWDSYTVTQASTGTTQTYLEGNAFSNPGVMIAGSVAVMIAIVAVAALAALWRPAKQGAWLLAGAIVPLAAQAVSALIQVNQPAYSLFGLTQAQARDEGITIASGMAPIFWVYVVFVIALIVSFAWLLTTPGQPAVPAMPMSPWMPPASAEDGGLGPDSPEAAAGQEQDADDSDDEAFAREAGFGDSSDDEAFAREAGFADDSDDGAFAREAGFADSSDDKAFAREAGFADSSDDEAFARESGFGDEVTYGRPADSAAAGRDTPETAPQEGAAGDGGHSAYA